MPVLETGDILLFSFFPFSSTLGGKNRPALLILDTGDNDVLVARVTGQIYNTNYDVQLSDWENAGLKLPSVVRLHKLATLEKKLINKQLGKLSDRDLKTIKEKFHAIYISEQ